MKVLTFIRNIQSHVSKEILVLQCGLSSCDPGDIRETCTRLKEQKVKVSFISLLGQVYFSESITKFTGGKLRLVSVVLMW